MIYKFGEFQLDQNRHELRRGDQTIAIEPQVYDLIHLIVSKQGELVTRDEMIEVVWGGRIVSESAISARIASARKALGDDGKAQRIIQTVSRRGLRLNMPVAVAGEADASGSEPVIEAKKPPVRFARADDGTQIAYMDAGQGRAVFLVSHFPSNIEAEWSNDLDGRTLQELASHHRLILMDFRDSGQTDGPFPEDPWSTIAADMKAVLDHLEIEKTDLYGQSSGAASALIFAHTYPERVGKIILQGGYAQGRMARLGKGAGTETISLMVQEGWDTPGSSFISSYLSAYVPDATPAQIDALAEIVQSSATVETALKMRDLGNRLDILHLLPDIPHPTLVIHSRGETVHPPSEAKKLAKNLPNASLAIFDSRNHYILQTEECWPEFIDTVLTFLASD